MRQGALAALVLLFASPSYANPIATEVMRLRQISGTKHVQVTYGSYDAINIASITRDGTTLNVTWTPLASFKTNTGSGLADIGATQFCDCDLSLGEHEYVLKRAGSDYDFKMKIEVVEDVPPPRDAGVGDMMPWDIPELPEVQGLKCDEVCGAPADAGADSAVAKDAGPTPDTVAPQKDSGQPGGEKDDDGGCAISSGASPLALLLLGLLILTRRRR